MTWPLSKDDVDKIQRVGIRSYYALQSCRAALRRLQGKRSVRYATKASAEALKAINWLSHWGMHP